MHVRRTATFRTVEINGMTLQMLTGETATVVHHIAVIYRSVARQCVHCCKVDAASQWEMAILGVSELRNP